MGGPTDPLRLQFTALRGLTLFAVSVFVLCRATVSAQESVPQLVEVYWQSSRTLSTPGVTNVVVLDDSICRAQVSFDQIQFFGLSRGETVAFAWVKEQRISIRVRVVARPVSLPPPRLSKSVLDALGNGFFGSSMQAFVGPEGNPNFFFLHHLEWQQQNGGNRLSVRGQVQDSTAPGTPLFNANSASIQYSTPQTDLTLMDFPLYVNGGMDAKVSPYSAYNVYMVRGADVTLGRGANRFEFFGGATIPPYYLTLGGTRDVAGFNFNRKQGEKLYLYATTGWVNSPFLGPDSQLRRENSFFQTAGFAYRPNLEWAIQGSAGGSTRGSLTQAKVSYTGEQLTAFLTGTASSPDFPLNQLQLFFAGGSSVTAGTTLRVNSHLAGSIYFQHSATKSTAFFPSEGVSDYLNPNLSFAVTPRQSVTLNYAYSRNRSGLTLLGRNHGQRFDIALNSRLGPQLSNTAQLTFGALNDPLRLNAQGEFIVRDALSFPLKAGFVTVGFQHTRNDPSLVKRLNDQISLLPPALQQLFLLDPVAFVESSNLDPEIRALLQNLQPTDTEVSVSGQFHIGNRLNFSPNVGYIRNAAGLGRNANSHLFGYSLSYQVTPSIQLISSLSNLFLLDTQQRGVRRTTVITLGFNKTLSGGSRWLLPFRPQKRTIRGRVFRDLNVNGAFNVGEPGLAGVRVELNSGETVLTDSQGRFEFAGLSPGAYRVSVPLSQFAEAVRVTCPTDVRLELFQERTAEVNFGIVNFARVMGNVFNDYLLDGRRQPDANGLRGIRLTLTGNGGTRQIVTDGAGDYELYEIAPGDYDLSLDPATLPSNVGAPPERFKIHVDPTATIVQDIAVRALRSISGHVYLKRNGSGHAESHANGKNGQEIADSVNNVNSNGRVETPTLQPLAGIQLAIDHAVTTTDAEGSFVLRNLPAGDLVLTIVPASPLPAGLAVPAAKIKLPRDPIQIEGATVVISNPDLLNYLLPSSPER